MGDRNSTIKLLPGHTQDYTIRNGGAKDYQMFTFDVNLHEPEDITITLA
jgi:hypothetical protein